ANLANGREAVFVDPANFARRHFHQRVSGFKSSKRRLLPRTARDLAATSGSQFNVVNIRAQRNCAEWQRMPQIRRDLMTGSKSRPNSTSTWRLYVTALALGVLGVSTARRVVA